MNGLNNFTWDLRFKVLTVQFMCLPLLIGNFMAVNTWPQFKPTSSIFDRVFILKVLKDLKNRDAWFSRVAASGLFEKDVLEEDVRLLNYFFYYKT